LIAGALSVALMGLSKIAREKKLHRSIYNLENNIFIRVALCIN